MLEAIALCEEISGRKLSWEYVEDNRIGDHIWWISDVRKFREHYPEWNFRYGLQEILEEIHAAIAAESAPTFPALRLRSMRRRAPPEHCHPDPPRAGEDLASVLKLGGENNVDRCL